MSRPAARFRIEGRVQGVGYRWWAVGVARRLQLCGWVRNRGDGSVELFAVGEAAALDQMERACGQGPSAARVAVVVREPAEDDGSEGFNEEATV